MSRAIWPMRAPTPKTAVTVGTSSVTALAAKATRSHAWLQAAHANTGLIYLQFGGSDAVAGEGIALAAGQHFSIDGENLYHGAITAIASAAAQTLRVTEA